MDYYVALILNQGDIFFFTPRGHLAMSRDNFSCHNLGWAVLAYIR